MTAGRIAFVIMQATYSWPDEGGTSISGLHEAIQTDSPLTIGVLWSATKKRQTAGNTLALIVS